MSAVVFAIAFANLFASTFAFASAFVVGTAVVFIAHRAASREWLGRFWLIFWPAIVAFLYAHSWVAAGPDRPVERLTLLVMLALVPLVNMPFDWGSVGVTRFLLRWGCKPGAPSPFWLGLLDFAIGVVLIVPLGLMLIAALHLVDWTVVHGGGHAFLNVRGLLYAIEHDPWQAANWWIYLTLFSTLIPSVLNSILGAFSLITWMFPPLRHWLHGALPDVGEKGMDHNLIIIAVGIQVFLSVALPLVALVVLYNAALWLAPGLLPAFLAGAKMFAFWLLLVLPV